MPRELRLDREVDEAVSMLRKHAQDSQSPDVKESIEKAIEVLHDTCMEAKLLAVWLEESKIQLLAQQALNRQQDERISQLEKELMANNIQIRRQREKIATMEADKQVEIERRVNGALAKLNGLDSS